MQDDLMSHHFFNAMKVGQKCKLFILYVCLCVCVCVSACTRLYSCGSVVCAYMCVCVSLCHFPVELFDTVDESYDIGCHLYFVYSNFMLLVSAILSAYKLENCSCHWCHF